MTFARGGFPERIRRVLREAGGPVDVDFVVWKFRDEKIPPYRVKNTLKVMIQRGYVLSSRGDDSSVSGRFDVWLPAHTIANPSARRRQCALQQILCAPLVSLHGGRAA
jgi:hypothetical protein